MRNNLPRLWLGGNVFGWTADRQESFAILDQAYGAGIVAVDTADVYSAWAHEGEGGQSERIIGDWLAARSVRSDIVIASKVGMLEGSANLRPTTIRRALDASLERLRVDHVDLYYAHEDDGGDLTETLGTFDGLVRDGKVLMIGISNFLPAAPIRGACGLRPIGLSPARRASATLLADGTRL